MTRCYGRKGFRWKPTFFKSRSRLKSCPVKFVKCWTSQEPSTRNQPWRSSENISGTEDVISLSILQPPLVPQSRLNSLANFCRISHDPNARGFQDLHLLRCRPLAPRDNGTGMTHTAPRRRSDAGDKADHRFFDVL